MYATLSIPEFALQAALGHQPEAWRRPVALVDPESGRLFAATVPARAAGVQNGMTPAQAQARAPELELLHRVPEGEAALQAILLEAAGSVSAYLEATAPGLCTLDLQGLTLEGGPHRWGEAVWKRLASPEVPLRLGVAANPDLAILAARVATEREPVCVVEHPSAFLDPLPLEILEPPPELIPILSDWGIATLGALRRLPKGEIAARLGVPGVRLWERAAGASRRVLQLVRAAELFEERFDFEHEPETASPILFLLRRFADRLVERLNAVGLVAGALRFSLPLSDGTLYERYFTIPSPSADTDLLFRVLETHLETLRLDHGPTGVRLRAFPVKPGFRQARFFENNLRDPNRFAETLARLLALAGQGNVGIPRRLPCHRPDAFCVELPRLGRAEVVEENASSPPLLFGLPMRRYRPPLPASIQLENAAPCHLNSPEASGPVIGCLGPYRLSGQWWQEGWSTVEWDVAIGGPRGGLYRLSQQGEAWQLEGCYEQ